MLTDTIFFSMNQPNPLQLMISDLKEDRYFMFAEVTNSPVVSSSQYVLEQRGSVAHIKKLLLRISSFCVVCNLRLTRVGQFIAPFEQ